MDDSANPRKKFIFILGGVMSGIGKGITTSSLAKLLQSCGYSTSAIKADPYLNVDAGTMNPTEHGEVFVLDSGLETDQDMGNYERFLNVSMPEINYMTNGMIFKTVIDQERAGYYEGKCVEPTFHISQEIIRRIKQSAEQTSADITLIEIGGTVGEYQNAIFIEAARRMKLANPMDVIFSLITYLPKLDTIGEMKTKPTQNAVRQLNGYGVQPDIIVARSKDEIDDERRHKISVMCGVPQQAVISAPNMNSLYSIPDYFAKQDLHETVLAKLDLPLKPADLTAWQLVTADPAEKPTVTIGIVGKYFKSGQGVLLDAYTSVIEALKISALHQKVQVDINWIDAETITADNVAAQLSALDSIIVPGGFGSRGIDGKLLTLAHARQTNIPCLAICYGMQLMCIEYARNVCKLPEANTTEINPDTPDPIVALMNEQHEILASENFGGSMRLGSYPCELKADTLAHNIYQASSQITERHRHRFEINPHYVSVLTDQGLVFSGFSPDRGLMEIVELPPDTHPFYLGTQFHPEFLARVMAPHPIFDKLVQVSRDHHRN